MHQQTIFDERRLNILTQEDKEIIWNVNSVVNHETFEMSTFLHVVNLLVQYFESSEFLGNDFETLIEDNILNLYSDKDFEKRIKDLESSRRADVILEVIFSNGKFKKFWNILNASKVEATISSFCKEVHSQNFSECVSLQDYINRIEEIYQRVAPSLKGFKIVHGKEQSNIEISGEDMSDLGLILVIKDDRYILLNRNFRKTIFCVKGFGTFSKELLRVIEHAIKNKLNISEFVDASFQKGGMLNQMMRIEITDSTANFTNRGKANHRDYNQTMHMLNNLTLRPGLCPAALGISEEYSNDTLPIAQTIAQIVVAAVPNHLKYTNVLDSLQEFVDSSAMD